MSLLAAGRIRGRTGEALESFALRLEAVPASVWRVLAFALIVSLILIATRLGQVTRRCRLALLGAAFLGCFIVIRAVSFHHVDQLLGLEYSGLRVNWILELGGIGCIALAAGWRSMNRGVPVTAA